MEYFRPFAEARIISENAVAQNDNSSESQEMYGQVLSSSNNTRNRADSKKRECNRNER